MCHERAGLYECLVSIAIAQLAVREIISIIAHTNNNNRFELSTAHSARRARDFYFPVRRINAMTAVATAAVLALKMNSDK